MDQKYLDKLLFNALNSNDIEGIKDALEKGANGNVETKKGATPLMILSKLNHNSIPLIELADCLIEAGADVNYINKKGFTVLSNMMKSAFVEINLFSHLIKKHNADINQTVKIKQDGELKEFSLLEFAYMNSLDKSIIEFLESLGAKKLFDSDELKESFESRYEIMDKGFRDSGIYDIIEEKTSGRKKNIFQKAKNFILKLFK
ncbi:MAG: hypothetical protein GY714_22775 [Desulfobacterales bacterium]|nr:hypothetical protein [Desulfobacterales bacterium]MCP4162248.1 hypothetical protein [Deltaproteobacteria bacterium]